MKTIYISGPLTGVKNAGTIKMFYERIGSLCESFGIEAYIPHVQSDPILHPNLTPQQVYQLDRKQIEAADFVIAYVGVPSLGVGQEIEIAFQNGVPVILVYEENRPVSRMVRGNPIVASEITGANRHEILSRLSVQLQALNKTELTKIPLPA